MSKSSMSICIFDMSVHKKTIKDNKIETFISISCHFFTQVDPLLLLKIVSYRNIFKFRFLVNKVHCTVILNKRADRQ